MNALGRIHRKGRGTPGPESRTFCRIVGQEVVSNGKTHLLIQPITDPRELEASRKRYAAVMMHWFEEARKKRSSQSPQIAGDGGGV